MEIFAFQIINNCYIYCEIKNYEKAHPDPKRLFGRRQKHSGATASSLLEPASRFPPVHHAG
jgi:hypothetical protein